MPLQGRMDISKGFAEVVEILKTISYHPAYHWVKGQNVWKKECKAMLKFFFFWKITNNFKPVRQAVRLLYLFLAHNVWDSGNSGWKRYSHVILGNQSRSMVCFMVII